MSPLNIVAKAQAHRLTTCSSPWRAEHAPPRPLLCRTSLGLQSPPTLLDLVHLHHLACDLHSNAYGELKNARHALEVDARRRGRIGSKGEVADDLFETGRSHGVIGEEHEEVVRCDRLCAADEAFETAEGGEVGEDRLERQAISERQGEQVVQLVIRGKCRTGTLSRVQREVLQGELIR